MSTADPNNGKKKSVVINNDYRQLRHLPQSAMLEESGSPRLVLMVIAIASVVVLGFVIWSAITHIDEVASATGTIIPKNKIQPVQHLEGGQVSNLYVNNGDAVAKGQVLVQLSKSSAYAELERALARKLALTLDTMRLRAFIEHRKLDYQTVYQALREISPNISDKELEHQIASAMELLIIQNRSREDEIQILKLQLQQRNEELAKSKERRDSLEKHVAILQKEQKIYRELKEIDSVGEITLLNATRDLNKAYGDLVATVTDLHRQRKSIEESKQRLASKTSELRREALSKIGEKSAVLHELGTSIERLRDKLERLSIRSPENGLVKGMELIVGSVIPPGGTLMEVVPFDQELIVAANLETQFIGHVKAGDKANVKVTTFDFVRYGQVEGSVLSISPATFVSEEGKPFYKVEVVLDKSYVGDDPTRNNLLPGMIATVDIITGSKSLLNYLLKPIHRSLQEAFRER